MSIVAILVALVLAFRFISGMIKFAVLALIVLVALYLAHAGGAF